MELFDFNVEAKQGSARAATFKTAHGLVQTPLFMPVGTLASVKAVTVDQLEEIGSQIVLANTYHLSLRPGADLIEKAGGLHEFMQYKGPMLTDSGGFQIFSLADTLKIDDDGVNFASIYDGAKIRWTPEINMEIQQKLGADIIMQLDQCPGYPATYEYVEKAVDLSAAWAARCLSAHTRKDQALFGIVQGGMDLGLRKKSMDALMQVEKDSIASGHNRFAGFGIGGYSVGEEHDIMFETLGEVAAYMPANRPRYLMGVGNPTTLLRAVHVGVDMFDCVLPTRTARMGTAFSNQGRVNIRNASNTANFNPIDEKCSCPVCAKYSRAYLRHLIKSKEMLGATLLSIHNLHFLLDLMRRAREAICDGSFDDFYKDWMHSDAADDY